MNPNLRTITSKTTLPAGVAQSGTLTTDTAHNDRLVYSGTAAALDAILSQGRENVEQTKDNLWVFVPTSDLLLRVLSWGGKEIKVDGDASGVSAEAWQLVESKLVGWSVLNQGDTDGKVDGDIVEAGNSVEYTDALAIKDRVRYVDAVYVDGTGTSFLAVEKY